MLNFLRFGSFRVSLMDPESAPAGGGTPPPAVTLDSVRSIISEVLANWKPPVAATAPPVPVAAPPAPVVAPPVVAATPEQAAVLDEMRRNREADQARIATLEAANEASTKAAEASARENVVVNALRGYEFVNTAAAHSFQRDILARVTRAASGTLVIGDLPVASVIKNELEGDFAYNLKPKSGTGSGAGGGMPSGSKTFSMDDIKPGMTVEQKRAFRDVLVGLNSPYVKR
jgi:hypothetical protein